MLMISLTSGKERGVKMTVKELRITLECLNDNMQVKVFATCDEQGSVENETKEANKLIIAEEKKELIIASY